MSSSGLHGMSNSSTDGMSATSIMNGMTEMVLCSSALGMGVIWHTDVHGIEVIASIRGVLGLGNMRLAGSVMVNVMDIMSERKERNDMGLDGLLGYVSCYVGASWSSNRS